MAGKRQRGVIASRIKLEHFMAVKGIKSQAELARKIADVEGLDSEPKDLVNRIFRQNKVEHHSLERVAKALNIDAFKLYLTQDDQAIIADNLKATENSGEKIHAHKRAFPLKWLTVIFGVLVALTLVSFFLSNIRDVNDAALKGISSEVPPQIHSSLIFPSEASIYPLAQYITEQASFEASNIYRFGLVPQALAQSFNISSQALLKYEVDSILWLDVVKSDRYLSLVVNYYSGESIETIGVINLSKNELIESHSFVYKSIQQLLSEKAKLSHKESEYNRSTLVEDSKNIIQARALSEQFFDIENMAKANKLLDGLALQNAESLAIQCLIKVNIGWHSNEKESFTHAKDLCERALVMNSQHPMVRTTNAFRLFRNGQLDIAAREYHAILTEQPNNIEGLLGQAQLSMQYYLINPSERKQSLDQAISLAQQAILQEPEYWKSYHVLSSFFYLSKQPAQALAVIKKLTSLVANQITLANGAILSLCQAVLDDAHVYAEKMLALDPHSYIAYETLFFINAYQKNPRQALIAMTKAMANFSEQGGLFMQWGQLADAYRWAGNKQQAIAHYQTALVEYQQDKTKGQTTLNDEIYSLYFQAAILKLQSTELFDLLNIQLNNMDVANMPSSHQLKAAVLYHWLGDTKQMTEIKQALIRTCPIYDQAIDLM